VKPIDSLLLHIWKAISVLTVFVFHILLKTFQACILFLKRFDFFAKFANSDIIRTCKDSELRTFSAEKVHAFFSYFSKKMQDSRIFRRCAFIIMLILLCLFFYPPSHWGPWFYYETGIASYYSDGFWFKKTKSGERFIPWFYTAAHKTLPMGTTVKVKNLNNGKIVYVRINDRGPFIKGRIIDLSSAAAKKIGAFTPGTAKVVIYTRKKISKRK